MFSGDHCLRTPMPLLATFLFLQKRKMAKCLSGLNKPKILRALNIHVSHSHDKALSLSMLGGSTFSCMPHILSFF
ncbi:hypothetical protein XELAEV_18036088mg [Xenopus laevis]|uniref:Uncharacterized protein n=1 Tax=Xenopus laevis TaxID=8355 RepID=A0A974CH97_XENLA|nr:hypothetical protein XELAEV_18036088mg [Xenopus laevis]